MRLPPLKRKIKLTLKANDDKRKKQGRTQKFNFSEEKITRQILNGATPREAVKAISQLKHIPKAELQAHVRSQSIILTKMLADVQINILDNAVKIMEKINPDLIHPNSRPLAAAILFDKAMKVNESMKDFATVDATPNELLLTFLKEHSISFDQLTNIVKTGQCPPSLPIDLFRRLQDILRQRQDSGPKTIDVPSNTLKPI